MTVEVDTGGAAPLSKSKYLAGLRCHKLLWLQVHEPETPGLAPDVEARFRMEQGNEVEALAREQLGAGGLVTSPDFALEQRLRETELAFASPAALIFEATVQAGGAVISADALRRTPGGGFDLIEVKSSTSLKDEQLADVAFQLWVLRQAGVNVRRAFVMHLNRECRHPDLSNLFVTEEVTGQVEALLAAVPAELAAQHAMLRGPVPVMPLGDYCRRPERCQLWKHCWSALPPHHVTTLYHIRWKSIEKQLAAGRETVHALDESMTTVVPAKRQIRAVRAGRRIIEPGLAAALETLRPPVAWLDFETVGLAIPVWPGCAPYEQVPVQYSVHWSGGSDNSTRAWLAEPVDDPRPALAAQLVRACEGAATVVAYYAAFEKGCLEHLAQAVPQQADALRGISARMVDLLPIVRDHVYDPAFLGSFSLKAVLPVLVPDLSYRDLDVQEGGSATALLARLLRNPGRIGDGAAQARLRAQLLAYCERDTLAMVRLADALHEMARDVRPLH